MNMQAAFLSPPGTVTRLQRLQGDAWQQRGMQVYMKREDERDPLLGGNKWCKLQGWLEAAQARGVRRLVSVGGRWSNHLHALAHAGQRHGFETVGIVRADSASMGMTDTLREAAAAGMVLKPVSREEFRRREDPRWQEEITQHFGPCLFIPEGGAGQPALSGLARLAAEIEAQLAGRVIVALSVGSGTTLAGLRLALPERFNLVGFQAFADRHLAGRIEVLVQGKAGWCLRDTTAMRQHRQLPQRLGELMPAFAAEQGIELDPVYTVRMMAGLQDMITAGEIAVGSTVMALHSGGLQGRRGHAVSQAA